MVVAALVTIAFGASSVHAQPPQGINVNVINPSSHPVPVTIRGSGPAVTHLQQPAQNHVMLVWVAPGNPQTPCTPNSEFRQVFPDGTFANEAYVVPAGGLLVVTDLDVTIGSGTQPFQSGQSVNGALMPVSLAGSSLVPHRTSGVLITNGTSTTVSINSNLGAGVLIGAGLQVCTVGESRTGLGGFFFHDVLSASVRGYLISAPAN
jgi:hypothetical protein